MKRYKILSFFLLIQIVLVKTLAFFPEFIEKWYSNGWYPKIAFLNRRLWGSIPISIGDIIYILLILMVLKWFWNNRKGFFKNWKANGLKIVSNFSIFYFVFHLFWGMNYYRIPLDKKLQIEKEYTREELVAFTEKMIETTNALHLEITKNDSLPVVIPYSNEAIFKLAQQGYQKLPAPLKEFQYETESIKPSLLRVLLSYMGFGGYLNPFTGAGSF